MRMIHPQSRKNVLPACMVRCNANKHAALRNSAAPRAVYFHLEIVPAVVKFAPDILSPNMQPSFVHLRLHSEYSIADGIVRIGEAVALQMPMRCPRWRSLTCPMCSAW